MDFNAGRIVEGQPLAQIGRECISYLLQVCNGMESAPEKRKYGGTMSVYAASTPL